MADEYIVEITEQAQDQLREIVRYISCTLQAPDTAMKIL